MIMPSEVILKKIQDYDPEEHTQRFEPDENACLETEIEALFDAAKECAISNLKHNIGKHFVCESYVMDFKNCNDSNVSKMHVMLSMGYKK